MSRPPRSNDAGDARRPRAPTSGATSTERARRYWDQHAGSYDRSIGRVERWLFGDGRAWVCSQAAGEVLEVAIGTGRNLPFYPPDARLTGVDYSPAMLELARERARSLGRAVDLREGDAHALAFPDASFDTVVCTIGLCSVRDDRKAVAELVRVLRPGGRLLLLDHIRGSSGLVRAVQRLLELGSRRVDEYQLRRPLDHVLAEGLQVERRERSKLGIVERLAARKPASHPERRHTESSGSRSDRYAPRSQISGSSSSGSSSCSMTPSTSSA
ncbi:MAG TPA: class I SAM-dependent methyltransferase [Actinomycetes bacterium]|jgi:SAM-dependent methyltransferase|nr:class I SAM-dependent methyltransferase [Actinomycetes bacterium]